MKDYEQLYYDLLHEYKNALKNVELLKQELEIYKALSKNKNIKEIIAKDLIEYLKKGRYIKDENKD